MATIDDILNNKKPDVVQINKDDNPANSRGERAPISNTPQGVQAPKQKNAGVVPGLNPKDTKPLPATPTAPSTPKVEEPKTKPWAPAEPATPATPPKEEKEPAEPATPSTPKVEEPNTKPTVEEHKENTKPQKPQASGEPVDESKFKPFGFYDNFRPEDYGETKEEREAREKRERREAVLATLADGFAAFHNAYSHARGTQPMQGLGGNASKLQQRLYKEKQDRENRGLKIYDMQQRAKQFEANENWRKSQEGLNKKALEVREGELQARKDRIALDDWTSQWKRDIAQGTLDIKKRQQEIDEAFKQGQISIQARNAASNELKAQADMLRAQKSGNTKVEEVDKDRVYDSMGRVTGTSQRKTTRQEGTNNSDSGGKGSAGKYDKYKQTQKKDYSQYKVK